MRLRTDWGVTTDHRQTDTMTNTAHLPFAFSPPSSSPAAPAKNPTPSESRHRTPIESQLATEVRGA